MDIRCERCASEYEIDDARIPAGGLTIKCATCAHVFKVVRGQLPPPPAFALRLRRPGGDVAANCPDAATLQQWIVEQRVLAYDEVSVSGQPWRRMAEVPEFATFFALLSMPPFPGLNIPTAPPPVRAPQPPPHAAIAAETTVTRPVLQLTQPEPPSEDNFRTVQVQMTPDMFPPAPPKSGSANRVPPPSPPAPPANSTGVLWPSLQSQQVGGGLRLESMPPTPAPSFSPPPAPTEHIPAIPYGQPSAHPPPAAAPHIPTAPSTPKATPVVRPPTPKTGTAKMAAPPKVNTAPAKAKHHSPESDPDLEAFMASRRRSGQTALIVVGVAVVVLLGAIGYFALPSLLGPKGPSAAQQSAYQTGRQIYLLDTASQFSSAEDAFREAIGSQPGVYPQAEGAMAELHAAWGEQLLAKFNRLNAEMKAMAVAGKNAEVLRSQVNEAAAGAKEKLGEVVTEVNAVRARHPDNLEAARALLDYDRLTVDATHATAQADLLKMHSDAETTAHIAAWEALDPKQAPAVEDALKGLVAQQPEFVRARVWLAELHERQGNTAAALADMQAVLKIAPKQEQANDFIDAQKAAPAPAATGAADAGVPNVAASAPAQEVAKETPREEHHRATSEEKKEKESSVSEASASGPVNVDHAIDEAGRDFEHQKYGAALDLYEHVLQSKPKLSDALYGRGLALYYLGRTDEAIAAFQKTLDVNHRFGDAMIGLAEAYKREGRKTDASKYYEQYVDMYPSGAQAATAKANINALK